MTLPQPPLTDEQQKILNEVDFLRGDLVRLLSGGPVMTVLDIDLTTDRRNGDKVIVTCGFFGFNQNYYVNPFPPEALKLWDHQELSYGLQPGPQATGQPNG